MKSEVSNPAAADAAADFVNGGAVRVRRLVELKPSPENLDLYRPVDASGGWSLDELSRSIRRHGVLEPLVISLDGYVLSGHRRLAAARKAGLATVPVRTRKVSRASDPDAFVVLLREHNRQRAKTLDEQLHEVIIDSDPDAAIRAVREYRAARLRPDVPALKLGKGAGRKAISGAKRPLLEAVLRVIEARRAFWPLSDRQVHYALLNAPPLTHAKKPGSRYRNDRPSYRAAVDILTRARLAGLVPMEAIGDETRPVRVWRTHPEASGYVAEALGDLFKDYRRDLQASQPAHVEILAEKNTVRAVAEPLAAEYCIPLTSGRGYCSLPPRAAIAERFGNSGKERLILLVLSDLDPDGEEIASSFGRSMRDDFGVRGEDLQVVKVALTTDQAKDMDLPPALQAKRSSPRYKKFVAANGTDAYELEAVPAETLQEMLKGAIERVLDMSALEDDIEQERRDLLFLAEQRRRVLRALNGKDVLEQLSDGEKPKS